MAISFKGAHFPPDLIPTVSLDVISLVASSCGYYRGQIEEDVSKVLIPG
jgi:hypothetical protein